MNTKLNEQVALLSSVLNMQDALNPLIKQLVSEATQVSEWELNEEVEGEEVAFFRIGANAYFSVCRAFGQYYCVAPTCYAQQKGEVIDREV